MKLPHKTTLKQLSKEIELIVVAFTSWVLVGKENATLKSGTGFAASGSVVFKDT